MANEHPRPPRSGYTQQGSYGIVGVVAAVILAVLLLAFIVPDDNRTDTATPPVYQAPVTQPKTAPPATTTPPANTTPPAQQ